MAVATAVVATMPLGFKPQLHHWVDKLEQHELQATLKLLLISMVLPRLLSDQGYGRSRDLNPFQLWWMVGLVAFIS